MKRIAEEEVKERILAEVTQAAREWWFLINLKAKFAGTCDYNVTI